MYYCIVNPSARSGKGKEIWEKLENKFAERGLEYRAVFTKGPGHASKLAKNLTSDNSKNPDEKEKRDSSKNKPDNSLPKKLVVLGGDGTLNEVINGIQDFDNTLLGYIPIGSSNDFARDLSYPKKIDTLIDRIIEGKLVRTLDLGKLTYNSMSRETSRLHEDRIKVTRLFDVSSGIGFDAAVCEEALSSGTKNFLNKLGLGKLTYGSIALRQLLKAEKVPCDIILENGETIHLNRFIFIAAMIHHYEGGGFNFAPDADLTDGKFNLVYAGDMPSGRMLIALPFSFFGRYFWIKGIGHHITGKVTIKTDKPMWVHTDGEVSVKSDNISLECLKKKLKMMN
ncbi:diacylglycerol/lipid kinase family protein [Butyrivibrio sp. YAB3001]|uniref:diacylglycerol/lipid kinase family protein n=1 Tax=Butyrivibrio sp. YAB3001 TaxID=1520812 RepID=UPI0008F618A0|nr:diacylglycerol kinase family protein [Butyrivibrio sp. YAB3001]SFB71968.1 lipid kinase, YegS/Rv2252/BmrU family [Butyrivibrio sp. YAB3001]